jgi:hypothetical protein
MMGLGVEVEVDVCGLALHFVALRVITSWKGRWPSLPVPMEN